MADQAMKIEKLREAIDHAEHVAKRRADRGEVVEVRLVGNGLSIRLCDVEDFIGWRDLLTADRRPEGGQHETPSV